MANCDPTTIEVKVRTKKQLDNLKIIPRESYDGVVSRLISNSGGTNPAMIAEALGGK